MTGFDATRVVAAAPVAAAVGIDAYLGIVTDLDFSFGMGRTAPDALIDVEPIVALWSQFDELGAFEAHAIDTTDDDPERTLRRVRDAITSGSYAIS